MNYTYYANMRPGNGDIQHWKYIKKKRMPDGRWRYYYDRPSGKKTKVTHKFKAYKSYGPSSERTFNNIYAADKYAGDNGTVDDYQSSTRVSYVDYDGLFDRKGARREDTSRIVYDSDTSKYYITYKVKNEYADAGVQYVTSTPYTQTYYVGKLSQFIDRAEQFIFKKVYAKLNKY